MAVIFRTPERCCGKFLFRLGEAVKIKNEDRPKPTIKGNDRHGSGILYTVRELGLGILLGEPV